MPVRYLSSSTIKWPDLSAVRESIDRWAREEVPKHSDLLRLGYFGSYARGDWGVGSDLDLIAIVTESSEAFERRNVSWSLTALPVPADLLIYTDDEWKSLEGKGGLFARTLSRETVWVYVRERGNSEMEISSIGEVVAYLRDKKAFFHERFGVTRMGVFGSFAQGGQTIDSDIDLVVEFEKGKKNIHTFLQLRRLLEKELSRKVDLGFEHSLKPIVRESIKGKIVYV